MSRVSSDLGSCSKALFALVRDFLASYRPAGFTLAVGPMLALSYSALASTNSFGGSMVAHANPNRAGRAASEKLRVARIIKAPFPLGRIIIELLTALLQCLDLLRRILCFGLERRFLGKRYRQLGVRLGAEQKPIGPLLVPVLQKLLGHFHFVLRQLELKRCLGNSARAQFLGGPNRRLGGSELFREDGGRRAPRKRDEHRQYQYSLYHPESPLPSRAVSDSEAPAGTTNPQKTSIECFELDVLPAFVARAENMSR